MTQENDQIAVNMLVTEDLFPLPDYIDVHELKGNAYTLVTDSQGAVQRVVTGKHMILHMTAKNLFEWMGTNPFWIWDSEKSKFNQSKLSIVSH